MLQLKQWNNLVNENPVCSNEGHDFVDVCSTYRPFAKLWMEAGYNLIYPFTVALVMYYTV